ncbi:MAG: DUF4976 domain-containing protein [Trueperaceae bacterium]|nr:DUF4976 domain-containing protein [Trueperaceae bacterium]
MPEAFQGRSFRDLLHGETPADWREAMYYRYWMHKAHHNVYAHYGVRTKRHKLIYYYSDALGAGRRGRRDVRTGAGALRPGSGPLRTEQRLRSSWVRRDGRKAQRYAARAPGRGRGRAVSQGR